MSMVQKLTHNESCRLIVTIVKKGMATRVIAASKKAGAQGGTILLGRSALPEGSLNFWNIEGDPEREVVFTLIEASQVGEVLRAIEKEGQLNKPGQGISFVLGLTTIAGIVHGLK